MKKKKNDVSINLLLTHRNKRAQENISHCCYGAKRREPKKKIKTTQNPDWMNGINGSSEPFHAMILLFYLFDGYLMINMCCSTMCFFHFRIIQCANHLNTYIYIYLSEYALMYSHCAISLSNQCDRLIQVLHTN